PAMVPVAVGTVMVEGNTPEAAASAAVAPPLAAAGPPVVPTAPAAPPADPTPIACPSPYPPTAVRPAARSGFQILPEEYAVIWPFWMLNVVSLTLTFVVAPARIAA